ncbi:MAG: N-ethylammeline chlorohydrolase [Cycloclasticus sp. symbiont of Poecilosclerida sp. M]|nr:MAG: N-ethylammeline chlorohydrolase [Cycloclasticus sp. symbiont of Poecilosclerida sp. M]
MQVSQQINARWIIPIDDANSVYEHQALIIQHDKIIDIVPQKNLSAYQPKEVVELNDHALIPGLINAHTHAAMSLLKGLADDLPLDEWLNNHIWPAETALADEDFVRDGSELAIAEMIKGGTTCFNDMYFFPNQTIAQVLKSGIRANIGAPVIDFPTRWAKDLDEYVSKGVAIYDETRDDALITISFAPHAPYTVSDESFKVIQPIINELGLTTHIHLHETAKEVEESIEQDKESPIFRLKRLGLLGPDLMAVHMIGLSTDEIKLVADFGVHVIHCPRSNLKLASGICPVDALTKAGVNVALGTDGSASNNDLDMLSELRTACLIAKGESTNANTLPAIEALKIATINGAKALGLDKQIGSLEAGKQADITAINLNSLETQPVYDAVASVAHSASRSQVSDVWVAGKRLLDNYKLTTIDEPEVLEKAAKWQEKIKQFHHRSIKAV